MSVCQAGLCFINIPLLTKLEMFRKKFSMRNDFSCKHCLKVSSLKFYLTDVRAIVLIKPRLTVLPTEWTPSGSSTGTHISGPLSNVILAVTVRMRFPSKDSRLRSNSGDHSFRRTLGNPNLPWAKEKEQGSFGFCVSPRSLKSIFFLAAVHELILSTASYLCNSLPSLGERGLHLCYMLLQHPVKWWWDLQGFLKCR